MLFEPEQYKKADNSGGSKHQNKDTRPFLSLQFRWDTFISMISPYCSQRDKGLEDGIRALNVPYQCPTEKIRMYADEKAPKTATPAVMFEIDKMTFLPAEVCDRLKEMAGADGVQRVNSLDRSCFVFLFCFLFPGV